MSFTTEISRSVLQKDGKRPRLKARQDEKVGCSQVWDTGQIPRKIPCYSKDPLSLLGHLKESLHPEKKTGGRTGLVTTTNDVPPSETRREEDDLRD